MKSEHRLASRILALRAQIACIERSIHTRADLPWHPSTAWMAYLPRWQAARLTSARPP